MEGYDFQEQRMSLPDFIKMGIKTFQGGPLQPFLSYSKWCSYCGEAHALESCYKLNPTTQAPHQDYQQSPQELGVNMSQEVPQEDTFQALKPQSPWCAICGGSHAMESCYMLAPIYQVPHQDDQQQAWDYNVNVNQEAFQGGAPPMFMPQPLWCAICGGPHEAERCYIFSPNFQYQGQDQEPPHQEPQQQYQDQFQEVPYQEPQQECQSFDQDAEMKSMMANMLMQLNELQNQMDQIKAQRQGLTTQEPIKDSFSNGEVLQELLLQNEGHVVDVNEKEGEDLEDEYDEVCDECIEMETPSWEESVDLQGNGDKKQLEDGPSEEVLKNDEIDETCGTNEECPSLDDTPLEEDFRIIWEPGGVNVLESFGPHWPIFESNDSHFLLVHEKDPRFSLLALEKESQDEKRSGDQGNYQAFEYYQDPRFRKKTSFDLWIKNGFEEGIFLKFDLDEHSFLNFEVVKMSLREFINGYHLKCFLEEKVDGKKGIFILKSFDG